MVEKLKLLLVDNIHLYKTPNGIYYTPSIYNYEFFQRYLNVFDKLKLVSKVKYVDKIDENKYLKVTRDNLEIYELPWYQGFKQMISKLFLLNKIYKYASVDCDCIIYRVAQIESFWTYFHWSNRKKPFAVEVVNDPKTFINTNSIIKKTSCIMLKKMTYRALGASYVTKEYLQKLYPSYSHIHKDDKVHFTDYYSSIELLDSEINKPIHFANKTTFNIVHVGNSINDNTKGQLTLIHISHLLLKNGYDIKTHIIGDGNYIPYLKEVCQKLGISSSIIFHGRLANRNDVLNTLRLMDIFIYPTNMEGLPRVIIEAMGVGLPVLSTPIAGIPELLNSQYLFSPNDVYGFAQKMMDLFCNQDELSEMSIKNVAVAQEYVKSKLNPRREKFYLNLRNSVK